MITYQKFMLRQHLHRRVFARTLENDHEHCVMCGSKFTAGMTGLVDPKDLHWVCEDCFVDYRDEYDWILEDNMPSPKGHLRL